MGTPEQQSPILMAPGVTFVEDNFSMDWSRKEGWFGDNLSILHVLWTLFLLVLHQCHLRSSDIRSRGWENPWPRWNEQILKTEPKKQKTSTNQLSLMKVNLSKQNKKSNRKKVKDQMASQMNSTKHLQKS